MFHVKLFGLFAAGRCRLDFPLSSLGPLFLPFRQRFGACFRRNTGRVDTTRIFHFDIVIYPAFKENRHRRRPHDRPWVRLASACGRGGGGSPTDSVDSSLHGHARLVYCANETA